MVQTITGILIFTLVLLAGLALLKTDPDLLIVTGGDDASGDETANLSPSQTVLHDKLTSAMSTGGYREAGPHYSEFWRKCSARRSTGCAR